MVAIVILIMDPCHLLFGFRAAGNNLLSAFGNLLCCSEQSRNGYAPLRGNLGPSSLVYVCHIHEEGSIYGGKELRDLILEKTKVFFFFNSFYNPQLFLSARPYRLPSLGSQIQHSICVLRMRKRKQFAILPIPCLQEVFLLLLFNAFSKEALWKLTNRELGFRNFERCKQMIYF